MFSFNLRSRSFLYSTSFLISLGGVSTSALGAAFNAVLPNGMEDVAPENMSFNPNKYVYSDDFAELMSLRAEGAAIKKICAKDGWKKMTDTVTDASGKSVPLTKYVCVSPADEAITAEERTLRRRNAKFIFDHISEGKDLLPSTANAETIVVGNRIPYSGDWYALDEGATLENPNTGFLSRVFARNRYVKRNVRALGPTTSDLLNWKRKGNLDKHIAALPMPFIIDILNGNTDPKDPDFYAFTKSEQILVRKQKRNFIEGSGWSGLRAKLTLLFSASSAGMCGPWAAASMNEPLPRDYQIKKWLKTSNGTDSIQFSVSAEMIAAANASLYQRLLTVEMDNTDPNKTEAERRRANALIGQGFRRVGEMCLYKPAADSFSEWFNSRGYNTNLMSTRDGEFAEKNCNDVNFGVLGVSALNKIGVFGDTFFADLTSRNSVWNYPVAGVYVQDLGPASNIDSDAALGTFRQHKVNLFIIHGKTHTIVRKGDFAVKKYPGRLDLTKSEITGRERIIGGRFTTPAVIDNMTDVRKPELLTYDSTGGAASVKGSLGTIKWLGVIKWLENRAAGSSQVEIPASTFSPVN